MIVLRNILCPVDSSDFSARALRYAMAFGQWYDAKVTALFVRPLGLPPALWFGVPPVLPLEGVEEREQTAAAIRHYARDAAATEPETVLVTDGVVADEIIRVGRELPADLIVMGTHGASGFERLILGSITEKTLRRTPCPVLTVPRRATETPEPSPLAFRTIVCGVDRSATSRHALRYAQSLAAEAGGRLVLVHALEDLSEEDPRFASHFNTPECFRRIAPDIQKDYETLVPPETRAGYELEVLVPQGKPYRELLNAGREHGADLIVMGTAGSSALFGTTTQHVLREAECPVLAVPDAPAPRAAMPGPADA